MSAQNLAITDLPLYLFPQFPVNANLLVLVEMSGINMLTRTTSLRIVYPFSFRSTTFTTVRQCMEFLKHPQYRVPDDWWSQWAAFSHRDILDVLKCYLRATSGVDAETFVATMNKRKYPLQELLRKVDPTRLVYEFEPLSDKHKHVQDLADFIRASSPPESHLSEDNATSTTTSTTSTTTPSTTMTQFLSSQSNPLDPSSWSADDWKLELRVQSYFENLRLRIQDCKHDPDLVAILKWQEQAHGGWDVLFLCQFETGHVSASDVTKHWVHYRNLQINPLYKSKLDDFLKQDGVWQRYIKDSLL
jgi:hypothetical protein